MQTQIALTNIMLQPNSWCGNKSTIYRLVINHHLTELLLIVQDPCPFPAFHQEDRLRVSLVAPIVAILLVIALQLNMLKKGRGIQPHYIL